MASRRSTGGTKGKKKRAAGSSEAPRKKAKAAPTPRTQAKAPAKTGAKAKPSGAKAKPANAKPRSKSKPVASSAKGVKLLSGGNPQIPKGDGDAPVKAYIEAMPGWKREVGRWLDGLIERIVPDVRKAVRWNTPFYGVEGQGWFLAVHCYTTRVNVTFFAGTSLEPVPPGPSKAPNVRYYDIYEGERDEALMESWIQQAAVLPGWTP